MRFVWNEEKNRRNQLKHKVSFETAISVFDDPHAMSIQDRFVQGEERWQKLGLIEGAVALVVAHSIELEGEEEIIRIILCSESDASGKRNLCSKPEQHEVKKS